MLEGGSAPINRIMSREGPVKPSVVHLVELPSKWRLHRLALVVFLLSVAARRNERSASLFRVLTKVGYWSNNH